MNPEINIRVATLEDAEKILEIYGYYIENTAITYEYEIPTLEEFTSRMIRIKEIFPYLVAEMDGEIVGYAYADKFNYRPAYDWNAELTIYLDHNQKGKGIGEALYSTLEEILKKQGIIKTIALITPPQGGKSDAYNSMHFHEKMGYKLIGCIEKAGYKFNHWFDTILMDKYIGEPADNMKPIVKFKDLEINL